MNWIITDELLGAGCSSETYKAYDKNMPDVLFAAKVMANACADDAWENELKIQKLAAESGAAIDILDHWEQGDEIVFIMPLLKSTLYDIFLNKDQKDKEIYKKKSIKALKALKRKNILHNDIKLDNLMIGYDENVYVIDYGCSKISSKEESNKKYKEYKDEIIRQMDILANMQL